MQKIILASQSPRRKMLLEWAEVPFKVIVKHSTEDFPPGTPPQEAAIFVATQKAYAVQADALERSETRTKELQYLPVLAADTMVVLNGQIIGKPISRLEALETLAQLSGQTHEVVTGVCILHQQRVISFADVTRVTFHTLTPEQIEYYVDKYQPYDKAGAYAIQEWIGVVGIKGIEGDFYNVMGLPVSRVLQALEKL